MKSIFVKWMVPALLLGTVTMPVATHAEDRSGVEARLRRQEKRIERGVDTGRLSPGETVRLRPREYRSIFQERQARPAGIRPAPRERIRIERAGRGNAAWR